MNKLKNKKAIILITIVIALLISLGLYRYNKVEAYNRVVEAANNYMEKGEYDKAIDSFKESLNYKEDKEIDKKIKEVQQLKNSQKVYNDAVNLLEDKKYEEALEKLSSIDENKGKVYILAKDKIDGCIGELINLANKEFKKEDYYNANKYLDMVLKYDKDNEKALDVRNNVKTKIEEKKNNEEKLKKQQKIKTLKEKKDNKYDKDKVNNKDKERTSNSKEKSKSNSNNNYISESKARVLVESVKPSDITLNYLGIQIVPYSHITTPYKAFPQELKNKKVYVFEGVYGKSDGSYAISQYYVDLSGEIYKDTYPSDGKCIRVK
ncbi:tetratricopeptide repeat protein [Clostridium botulinum]|uniref:TPR domain protein n=3 Tax=Clostridium botulinum TaxID=1491 RepID=C1FVR2_CLOBJ|nr:hypothetical protein [Clostridium botulinum]ACO86033.1 TPR domain protein [Clostridium botulinum A2 str. Kyoto]APC85318.1 TPR repeat family protein [Clostridium botulinum]APH23790.1 TPR repeat family protein [Clostridium botulinum]APQ69260.1 TPR repeat family protein [Clostridium botulinum]AUN08080.1 hypothetical protein RSJ14_15790 [Clostridium botulinum]